MSGGDVFFTRFFSVRLPREYTDGDALLRARVAAARRHPIAVFPYIDGSRAMISADSCRRRARIRPFAFSRIVCVQP